VRHARIAGPLVLAGRTLGSPVSFEDCVFEDDFSLDEATVPGVRLVRCELPEFTARSAHIQGDLVIEVTARTIRLASARVGGQVCLSRSRLTWVPALEATGVRVGRDMLCNDGFQAEGVVELDGARIDGNLDLTHATLAGVGAHALNATGLRVGGDMRCHDGFVARGRVWLVGADIAGRLDFAGAKIHASGWAVVAESVHAGGGMFCSDGFHAEGEVRLVGARIGGPLNLENGELGAEAAWALNAWGVQVDMGLWADGLTARGALRLTNARIRGPLKLRLLTLTGVGPDVDADTSLDLQRAEADELTLILAATPPGRVDLRRARVRQFEDAWGAPNARRYRALLGDFAYESLAEGSGDVQVRLDWIANAEDGFSPGAYDRLAAVLRAAGREEDARDVAIAREHARRPMLHRARRPVSCFLAATVGYGYRPWRAVGWMAALVLVGWWLFGSVWREDINRAPGAAAHDFQPLLFSLDAVLPVVKLGQEDHWMATATAQWWYAFSVLAGWLLATVLVAALTARLVRD